VLPGNWRPLATDYYSRSRSWELGAYLRSPVLIPYAIAITLFLQMPFRRQILRDICNICMIKVVVIRHSECWTCRSDAVNVKKSLLGCRACISEAARRTVARHRLHCSASSPPKLGLAFDPADGGDVSPESRLNSPHYIARFSLRSVKVTYTAFLLQGIL
jgi:hypothetical protein